MSESVELSIPVQSDLVVLARLTAVTVASRAGFDVEELENLRLAVDEMCVSIVDGCSIGRLVLTFVSSNGNVEVNCALDGTSSTSAGPYDVHGERDLSVRILDALVDEHGEEIGNGKRRVWLRKRRHGWS